MQDVETLWRSHYKTTPPLGHILSRDFSDRWLRVHALPKSKQYADTDQERETFLNRSNALGEELFGEGKTVYLMSTRAKVPFWIKDHGPRAVVRKAFKLKQVFTSKDFMESEEYRYPHVTHARKLIWKRTAFDDVFQKIADEKDYGVLFVSFEKSCTLAPYDGGFDLILPNSDQVKRFKETYTDWL